jgi:RHS repeat-associated protein
MTNSQGTSTFIYDSLNRRKKYIDMFGDTVIYTYDSVGNFKTIKYPGNHIVQYYYDSANLMTQVIDCLGNIYSYTYDSRGKLKRLTYPNGAICDYSYNSAGQLDTIVNRFLNPASIINKSVFSYDANGQRISEQRQGPIPFHLTASSFSYKYGPDDRLLSDSLTKYVNDNNGNRTADSSVASYNFSVDNLLSSLTSTSGTTSFHYDGLDNRIERKKGGNIRRYILDLSSNLSKVLMEKDSTGNIKATYIYGLGLLAFIDSANNVYYPHFDAQYNTVALSDDSAHITDTYTYDPFGIMLKHTGNSKQPFTFLGEYGVQMEDSVLYYIRARYSDAKNGRFLSKDPIPGSLINPQSLNKYVYSLNNPINSWDITGLCIENQQVSQNSFITFSSGTRTDINTYPLVNSNTSSYSNITNSSRDYSMEVTDFATTFGSLVSKPNSNSANLFSGLGVIAALVDDTNPNKNIVDRYANALIEPYVTFALIQSYSPFSPFNCNNFLFNYNNNPLFNCNYTQVYHNL